MKSKNVLIVDGYVDEPSTLGVPPYIAPQIRMIAGCLEELGLSWSYTTADEYRENGLRNAEKVIVYGGVTVPGKYLRGTPLSEREVGEIGSTTIETFLGGPLARHGEVKGFDYYSYKDLSAYFYEHEKGNDEDRWADREEMERWLKKGSKVVEEHPDFPDPLIAEISLYRGCVRYFTGGCSFCSESEYGKPEFREQSDVVEEIKGLYELGVRNFRIGGQSCTVSYMAEGVGQTETPKPMPGEIKELFDGIWKECPKIKVLHLDNANPSVIASWPERSKEIIEILVENTTPGNILALGLETADEIVKEKNNLNSSSEEAMKAVRIINETGRKRGENGMPQLLPGLNFLGGLKGETAETYEKNFRFLKKIMDEDLLLRRINIRQVLSKNEELKTENKNEFREFKKKVREEIDRPMLKKILPKGTVLKNVYMEKHDGKKTFGRQIGTYPLLVGVNYSLELGRYYDIVITDYGYRSVTGLRHPFYINEASFKELKAVPGIGENRASNIFQEKPQDEEKLRELVANEEDFKKIMDYVEI
ncbi:MAG: radical SAM protein [Candidatus Aenigmatarchaeota archaeon]